MITDILETLKKIDPQVYSAIINTFGILIVGWLINNNVAKLNHKHEIQLARESPIYQLRIDENRKFISAHYELIDYYLDEYYYHPKRFIDILALKYTVYGFQENEVDLLQRAIRKETDSEVNNLFDLYMQMHTPMYSIYLSMMPERFSFSSLLQEQYLSNLLRNFLFINHEIKSASTEIINLINNSLTSQAFTEFLWTFDRKEIPFMETYNHFNDFWNQQKFALLALTTKMQEDFIAEWNKDPLV